MTSKIRFTMLRMLDQDPMETTFGVALIATGLIPMIVMPWPKTMSLTDIPVLIICAAIFAIGYGSLLLARSACAATKRRRAWDSATPEDREIFANLPQFGELTDEQLADFVGVPVEEIRSCRIPRPRAGALVRQGAPRTRSAA